MVESIFFAIGFQLELQFITCFPLSRRGLFLTIALFYRRFYNNFLCIQHLFSGTIYCNLLSCVPAFIQELATVVALHCSFEYFSTLCDTEIFRVLQTGVSTEAECDSNFSLPKTCLFSSISSLYAPIFLWLWDFLTLCFLLTISFKNLRDLQSWCLVLLYGQLYLFLLQSFPIV